MTKLNKYGVYEDVPADLLVKGVKFRLEVNLIDIKDGMWTHGLHYEWGGCGVGSRGGGHNPSLSTPRFSTKYAARCFACERLRIELMRTIRDKDFHKTASMIAARALKALNLVAPGQLRLF